MKPLTQHERAALGLRQTLSDIDCAEQHLDTVIFAVDDAIAGLPADIQAVKQELFDAHAHLGYGKDSFLGQPFVPLKSLLQVRLFMCFR